MFLEVGKATSNPICFDFEPGMNGDSLNLIWDAGWWATTYEHTIVNDSSIVCAVNDVVSTRRYQSYRCPPNYCKTFINFVS